MRPKIAIILTPCGIDSVSVLPGESDTRLAGYEFCSLLEEDLQAFETAIRQKIHLAKWRLNDDEKSQ
jgi:hypothetical protein